MFLEQFYWLQDQVVEVYCVVGVQGVLVMQVDDCGGLFFGIVGFFQCFFWKDQVVFLGIDVVFDFVDVVVFGIFFLYDVGQQCFDV